MSTKIKTIALYTGLIIIFLVYILQAIQNSGSKKEQMVDLWNAEAKVSWVASHKALNFRQENDHLILDIPQKSGQKSYASFSIPLNNPEPLSFQLKGEMRQGQEDASIVLLVPNVQGYIADTSKMHDWATVRTSGTIPVNTPVVEVILYANYREDLTTIDTAQFRDIELTITDYHPIRWGFWSLWLVVMVLVSITISARLQGSGEWKWRVGLITLNAVAVLMFIALYYVNYNEPLFALSLLRERLSQYKPGILKGNTLIALSGFHVIVFLYFLEEIIRRIINPFIDFKKERTLLGILIAFTLIKGITFGGIIPLWLIPDEDAHFAYAQYLAEKKEVPRIDRNYHSQQLRKSMDLLSTFPIREDPRLRQAFQEGDLRGPNENQLREIPVEEAGTFGTESHTGLINGYPPFYYFVLVPAYLMFKNNILNAGFFLRLFSTLFTALLTLSSYFIVRKIFPQERLLQIVVPTLITLNPMVTFIGAGVNVDGGFLALLFTLFIGGCLYWYNYPERITWKFQTGMGILLGLGLLTKQQFAMAAIAFVILMMILVFLKKISLKEGIKSLMVVAGISALISGPWLLHNWQLFGDPFLSRAYFNVAQGAPADAVLTTPGVPGFIKTFLNNPPRAWMGSFIGVFGSLDLTYRWGIIYQGWTYMMLLAFLGLLFRGAKYLWDYPPKHWTGLREIIAKNFTTLFSGAIFIITFVFITWAMYLWTYVTEGGAETIEAMNGRYLFIIILPIMILLFRGFNAWIWKELRPLFYVLLISFFAVLNLYALYGLIIPRYFLDFPF